jgi:hypothetical protein
MQRPSDVRITGHTEYGPPRLVRPTVLRIPSPYYACITCNAATGDTVALVYLRPDTVQPWETIPGLVTPRNVYDPAGGLAVIYRSAWEYSYDVAMLHRSNPVFAHLDAASPERTRIYEDFPAVAVTQNTAPDLATWLAQNPRIGNQMFWTSLADGWRRAYPGWLPAWQAELIAAFQHAWNYDSGPWLYWPANKAAWDTCHWTVLDEDRARQIYLAYLGFMLALEIGHRVPWSILSYTDDQLAELFCLFEGTSAQYGGVDVGIEALPAAPSLIYSFLLRAGLIGPTTADTVSRVLDWCRRNLSHYNGSSTSANMLAIWGYCGYPPVERVIGGTVSSANPEMGTRHWTEGCKGTTGFLQCVLKVANIPVRVAQPDGHIAPWFMADNLYLSHGDDPYDQNSRATPPFPASELMITPAAYDAWFGAAVPVGDRWLHVSQQPAQLAVQHLPDALLHEHWIDVRNNLAPAASNAYAFFLQRFYPDITALGDLWTRMDDKLRAMGGLAQLPVTLPPLTERFPP